MLYPSSALIPHVLFCWFWLGAFTLYDIDRDGHISRDEMVEIVGAIYEMVGPSNQESECISPETKASHIFSKMDTVSTHVLVNTRLVVAHRPHIPNQDVEQMMWNKWSKWCGISDFTNSTSQFEVGAPKIEYIYNSCWRTRPWWANFIDPSPHKQRENIHGKLCHGFGYGIFQVWGQTNLQYKLTDRVLGFLAASTCLDNREWELVYDGGWNGFRCLIS